MEGNAELSWGMGAAGPRLLLRRMREIMAGSGSTQDRLDHVVRAIAANMVAEVCSFYILRPGDILELFATEGLSQDSVHKTTLYIGEGIVGDIAANKAPLKLANAWEHPAFAYRPETGEDRYHSMMGVPVVREDMVIGVLVVQNRTKREYTTDEMEAMQTVAMVLAELVSSTVEQGQDQTLATESSHLMPQRLEGMILAEGLGQGIVVRHNAKVEIQRIISDDMEGESRRLETALDGMREELESMMRQRDVAQRGEHREVLETFLMFAQDQGWREKLKEAIESGLTAEAAVKRVQVDMRARMSTVSDSYIRDRLHDMEDLANRLLRHLVGDAAAFAAMPEETILVARHMGPAELLDYDATQIKGVILEEGSPTAHVAVIARALGIPVMGGVRDIEQFLRNGDPVILDCEKAQIFIRPTPDVVDAFQRTLAAKDVQRAQFEALRDKISLTIDGHFVELNVNAGLLVDVTHMHEVGADGIGLYRTELPFMVRSEFPDVSSQTELYRRVLDEAAGKPVVFRTLDVGGDKVLPYFQAGYEENPAMGWRAVRIGLDRPRLLRHQLRALMLAASEKDDELHIMFPMIANVAELLRAKHLLEEEKRFLAAQNVTLSGVIRIGTMLEVPGLLWQLDTLLQHVDFVSVGSNDLIQFLYAADRGNPEMSGRYDPLSPGVINLLRDVVQRCDAAGVPLSVCGEMAGRPLDAMMLIACGVRKLSMAPVALGPVKLMLRTMQVGSVAPYVESLIGVSDHSVRQRLKNFAQDHGISI